MEIKEIVDNYYNGNKKDFAAQVKEYGAHQFFKEVIEYINDMILDNSIFVDMTLTYLYHNEK